jgi:hypothetical protein
VGYTPDDLRTYWAGVAKKSFHLPFFLAAAIGISVLQVQDSGAGTNQSPDREASLNYIHSAWNTLTRSMTDCHSLVDV